MENLLVFFGVIFAHLRFFSCLTDLHPNVGLFETREAVDLIRHSMWLEPATELLHQLEAPEGVLGAPPLDRHVCVGGGAQARRLFLFDLYHALRSLWNFRILYASLAPLSALALQESYPPRLYIYIVIHIYIYLFV